MILSWLFSLILKPEFLYLSGRALRILEVKRLAHCLCRPDAFPLVIIAEFRLLKRIGKLLHCDDRLLALLVLVLPCWR